MDLRTRPLSSADLPAWVELLEACALVHRTGEHYTVEDLAEDLETPGLELDRDTLAVLCDGRLAGYATLAVRETTEPVFRIGLDAAVHPELRGRGIGTTLLSWAIRSAEARHAAAGTELPLNLRTALPELDLYGERLLARHGFAAVRWFTELTWDLAENPPGPAPEVPGLTLRTYRDEDEEPLRLLRNAAFADHWGAGQWTVEQWQHYKTRSRSFRPDLTWLAVDADGTPVGLALTQYFEADTAATGARDAWIDTVGTAASHRKRGIASALIRRVARSAADLGFRTASLGVDSASPTGADTLYRSLGFEPVRGFVSYER